MNIEGLVSQEQLQIQRRLLTIAVEITKSYLKCAEERYNYMRAAHHIGMQPDEAQIFQAEAALAKAKAEREKADLALNTFEFNISQAVKRQDAVKAQIPKERTYLAAKIEQSKVVAPKAGKVTLLVSVGSFAEKGQEVARIA